MRSANADIFNHDTEAADYDRDVLNESDPVRAGYREILGWVIQQAQITPTLRVLELGSGTGNLSALIVSCRELVSVDVSGKMEAVAKFKLRHLAHRRFIKADILEVFRQGLGQFDAVISTYAVHHLTDHEKHQLFELVFACLSPGGRAVFGDLMVLNGSEKEEKIQQYLAKGDQATAQAISEEFFWLLDTAIGDLERLGFQVSTARFSDLSYGLVAQKLNPRGNAGPHSDRRHRFLSSSIARYQVWRRRSARLLLDLAGRIRSLCTRSQARETLNRCGNP
jgi:putative AdoMet-dependent methyltransferase